MEIKTNTGACPDGCPHAKMTLEVLHKKVRGMTVKTVVSVNCEHAAVCKERMVPPW